MEDLAKFTWYITPDQIEVRDIEIPNEYKPEEPRISAREFIDFDITNGRLKHRWVPTSRAAAIRFLLYHEDAAGLRAAADNYFIADIHLDEPIKNKRETYPKLVPSGHTGAVISVPFTETLMKGTMRDPSPRFSYSPRKLINISSEKEIFSLNMEIMSHQEIRDMSVVEVKQFESLKESTQKRPRPVIGGPMDTHMGSIGLKDECPVCLSVAPGTKQNNEIGCPGHFGHIDLAVPVPNILFLGERAKQARGNYPIMETLKNTCLHCKRIMLPQDTMDFYRAKILHEFETGGRNHKSRARIRGIMGPEFSKIIDRKCPHCEEVSPDVYFSYRSKKFGLTSKLVSPDPILDGDDELTFSGVVNIFEEIPDDDLYFVGVNPETSRPENMFFRYLPVIPNNARPITQRSDGKMELDDLTQLYADVVYASERIHEMRIGQQASDREEYWHGQLFIAVSRVIDNQNHTVGSGGSKTKYDYDGTASTVSFDGLLNRLDSKEGRFRHNLHSKYVDNVGYSTVSPDPNLAIDEVGVPIKVCKTVSYPRVVTEENIEEIKGYMRNTIDNVYPAARYVYTDGFAQIEESSKLSQIGTKERFRNFMEGKIEGLEVGMAVSIDLMEGDICLFNRAPSLHRQSIMAFRVRPVEGKTLSFNPTVCIPFNADYDGDAMKAHFIQSEEAKAEAEKLMMLTKNLIHARYGKLAVATDQDQTSGLYLLTYTDKSRRNTWNEGHQLGYNDEGIPYISKSLALSCYSTVFSEIRGAKEREYRTVTSLPESDVTTPYGAPGYTGRALFNHLFEVLDATYVSAWFSGRTPLMKVLEDGSVVVDYDENGKKKYEEVLIKDGKLVKGTLEKAAFGEGGASIAPSFIYHEGYEAGQAKLVEFIEMVTRLGFAAHRIIGYTMGIDDVSEPKVQRRIDKLYRTCLRKIYNIDQAYANGQLKHYVKEHTPEKMVSALAEPLDYIEEEVLGFTNEFENALLKPIENEQGSGNPMQIAVRSKARGKDINIRQMTGAFGQVRLGPKRVTYGLEGNRVLPHYPRGSLNPKHRGLIRGSYSSGMEPDEYFLTSIAGRRAIVESSQGNIAKSGYLERLMIKALESCVVNKRRQVVNLRTGRVISPLVGDDGLAPYHIRGSDDNVNEHGLTLTLQPLFFDFECKHGITLAEVCEECQKPSDLPTFIAKIDKVVAENTRKVVENKLATREMSKPNVKKLAIKLSEYFEDSLCRIGEAIGATAGACIGEPATQAALRTFHFAGVMQSQGDVERLRQILQYTSDSNIAPLTTIWFKEETSEQEVRLILSLLAEVKGDQIIKLISYDIENSMILVKFDFSAMGVYNISPDVVIKQINDAMNAGASAKIFRYEILSDRISPEQPFVIRVEKIGSSPSPLLYAKEYLMNSNYNGISGVKKIELLQPETDGRYGIKMLSANKDMLNRVVKLFGNKLDELATNNHQWVEDKYGLEAALANIYKELDFQMNLTEQGIGEYDNRYIRTIVDCMGEYGIVKSLGPAGLSGYDNPSILGGMSIQYVKDILNGGATMGNEDPIKGVTESVVVGKLPKIGDFAPE